jgi:DNA polymerase-1
MEAAGHDPFPDFSIFCVPRKQAVAYSGTDAAATALLDPVLDRLIDEKQLRGVYEMDRRAIPFVDRMQEVGMRVNVDKLTRLESDLEDLRRGASKKIRRIVDDRWFNPGSNDQVAAWLYEVKGLPIMTFTDSGRGSTADGALQMLKGYHAQEPEVMEFITAIQDYREADKFLGTFVRPIFLYLRQDQFGDWRIHPNFRITRVVSGRLSSFEPNVLAIPTRSDLGRRIREIFEARHGWVIISADYSQLELRVGAHYSRDRQMREAFENGIDLHALTASIIFKVDIASFKEASPAILSLRKKQRYVAKTINFAVFYGITARALLEALYKGDIFDFTLEDCERFIREWFKIYAAVPRFQKRLWKQAEQDGFVRTMFGRICYVPNIRVMDRQLQAAAQRLAANFPVQGTGSDTLKRAEIRLHEILESTGLRDEIWPWLQMHDELVLEVRREREDEARELIETCMLADRRLFDVPITADAGVGDSWATAKL